MPPDAIDSLIFSNVLFQNQEFVSGIHSRPGANIQEVILALNFGLVGQSEYVSRACLVYQSAKRRTFASWNCFYMVALFKWSTPAAIKKWCFFQSKPKSWTPPKACPNRPSLQLTGRPQKGVQFGQCVPILCVGESGFEQVWVGSDCIGCLPWFRGGQIKIRKTPRAVSKCVSLLGEEAEWQVLGFFSNGQKGVQVRATGFPRKSV